MGSRPVPAHGPLMPVPELERSLSRKSNGKSQNFGVRNHKSAENATQMPWKRGPETLVKWAPAGKHNALKRRKGSCGCRGGGGEDRGSAMPSRNGSREGPPFRRSRFAHRVSRRRRFNPQGRRGRHRRPRDQTGYPACPAIPSGIREREGPCGRPCSNSWHRRRRPRQGSWQASGCPLL